MWVGVHFGSRGFGHKTATRYLELAGEPKGGMDAPPALLRVDSELGQEYIAAMQLACDYAYAGRDVVVDRVLDILGASPTHSVHNNHNFASRETHDGEDWWVVRKGCTPAFPGQEGFVGSTMGEQSVILEGADTPEARAAFFSTVHGAGRRLSRTQAAGKMGVAYECSVRDCDFFVTRDTCASSSTWCAAPGRSLRERASSSSGSSKATRGSATSCVRLARSRPSSRIRRSSSTRS